MGAVSAPAHIYSVECADIERDRDEILGFWGRHLAGMVGGAERIDWEYRQNPAGPGRCWFLVAEPGHKRVGVISLVPRRMQCAGESVLAGRASTLAVDPEHRFLGPAVMLQRAVVAAIGRDGLDLVFTVAPPNGAAVARRVGYTEVGHFARDAKALDVSPHIQARVGNGVLGRALSVPGNIALRAVSRDTWAGTGGLAVRELHEFDERFDSLWERARGQYRVTTERTSAFLQWRFSRCPYMRFVTLGVLSPRQDRLHGYAVCVVQGRQATVFDLICENSAREFDVVVAGVIKWARGAGATTVSLLSNRPAWLARRVGRFGFHLRHDDAEPSSLLVARPSAALAGPRDPQQAEWYLLPADNF